MILSTYITIRTQDINTKITTTYEMTMINREYEGIVNIMIKRKEALEIIKKLNLTYDEQYKRYL